VKGLSEHLGKLIRAVLRGGDGGNAISLTRSWKCRLRYGTLICDLESSSPIDVLPDRSVATVSARAREASQCGNREPRSLIRICDGH
jgi:hypothetical protein